MRTQITRTDEKIRQKFYVLDGGVVLLRGNIYEQRNVMVTEQHGRGCSIQYASFDAFLQSLPIPKDGRVDIRLSGGN